MRSHTSLNYVLGQRLQLVILRICVSICIWSYYTFGHTLGYTLHLEKLCTCSQQLTYIKLATISASDTPCVQIHIILYPALQSDSLSE